MKVSLRKEKKKIKGHWQSTWGNVCLFPSWCDRVSAFDWTQIHCFVLLLYFKKALIKTERENGNDRIKHQWHMTKSKPVGSAGIPYSRISVNTLLICVSSRADTTNQLVNKLTVK